MDGRGQPVITVDSRGGGILRRGLIAAVDRALGLVRLDRVYRAAAVGKDPQDFLGRVLGHLGVALEVDRDQLERVPASGPAVVVANHPFGGIEGMALARVLLERRPDVRVMANFMLGRIPELREIFLLVDPFDTPESIRRNLATLRQTIRWVSDGGLLLVFPSGEVAHLALRRLRVADPPWDPSIGRLVRRARAPVVPVFFPGHNGWPFQLLGLVHPVLRTAMLPRQLLRRAGTTLEARIGRPIPAAQLAQIPTDDRLIDFLRQRTEILAERCHRPDGLSGPQRPSPEGAQVVDPVAPEELEDELAALPQDALLVETGELAVYIAHATAIPRVLYEIGRLRELTFRAAGEGSGQAIDLDRFDADYLHLFIWHRELRQLVGGYRLGPTDRLLPKSGVDGLYTTTLFRYRQGLFDAMGPALEMGRSWIRHEHQRSYSGLLLLWKGIGEYVVRNPRYAMLFGPVSISADYLPISRRLIVEHLRRPPSAHEWSRWVSARRPFRLRRGGSRLVNLGHLDDLDQVSALIAEIESDGKGVPILLRQYLKLGGRPLGFNVDPDFSNVLDVLLVVDLRRTEPRILERYMGRDGARSFLDGTSAAPHRTRVRPGTSGGDPTRSGSRNGPAPDREPGGSVT